MGVSEKTEFLSSALRTQIHSFNAKRKDNKRKALFFKLTVTVLGGTTTVLLGLQGVGHESTFRNLALVLSAMVTLLSTWDTFFNHRGLWTRYTATYTELRTIEADLEYMHLGGEGVLSESQVDELFTRYQRVLRNTNEWWQHERQEEQPVLPASTAMRTSAPER
jgi:hypothetical protein